MKVFIFFLTFFVTLTLGSHCRHRNNAGVALNDRPIIGVLTQEVTGLLIDYYGNHVSYVAASYVKHLESAGARVVPIWIGKNKNYYRSILSLVNGAFFPGGASEFNVTDGYAEAGRYIMEVAEEFNSKGDYFPVWGTCLGFELLGYIANGNSEIREDCSSHNEAIPLIFKPDFAKSKLFKDMPSDIVQILAKENSTMNFHQYCITEKGMKKANLLKTWTVMSTNIDENGLEYVSTMEHKTRPYWGVQFHPEKSSYEWNPKHNTPHTANAIRANQYFADFFIAEASKISGTRCQDSMNYFSFIGSYANSAPNVFPDYLHLILIDSRKNCHKFPSMEQERLYLIYNFAPTFGKPESTFTQLYFFD